MTKSSNLKEKSRNFEDEIRNFEDEKSEFEDEKSRNFCTKFGEKVDFLDFDCGRRYL